MKPNFWNILLFGGLMFGGGFAPAAYAQDVSAIALPPFTTGTIHNNRYLTHGSCGLKKEAFERAQHLARQTPSAENSRISAEKRMIYTTDCKRRLISSVEKGFAESMFQMMDTMKRRGFEAKVITYPALSAITPSDRVRLQFEFKRGHSSLASVLVKVEQELATIQENYLSVGSLPDNLLQGFKTVQDLDDLGDQPGLTHTEVIDERDKKALDPNDSSITQVLARQTAEAFNRIYSSYLSNDDDEVLEEPLRQDSDWIKPDMLLAHYYDVVRVGAGLNQISARLFLLDTGVVTPISNRHPVYQKASDKPVQGNSTQSYMWLINGEIGFLLTKFAENRR